jgi:PKD repeat protein
MTTPHRTVASVGLALLLAISTGVGAGVAAAAGTTALTVSIADGGGGATVAPGETTTVEVVVDDASGGVGAAELRVVTDPTVARVVDATVLGSGGTDVERAENGSSVDVEYAFRDTADTGTVAILTVTIEGVAPGETAVRLAPSAGNDELLVFDEAGTGYTVTGSEAATVTVAGDGPPPIGGTGDPPTDPDDDGLYEDVNGDGDVTIIDVAAFLDVYDTPTVESNLAAFDFDGNGRASIIDVATLLEQL